MKVRKLGTPGLWAATLGVILLATAARPCGAASLPAGATYSTAARFSGVGLPISFEGVQHRRIPDSGTIPMGRFVVEKPETGGDVVFKDSAFAVEFNVPEIQKVEAIDGATSEVDKVQFDGVFTVEGRLNGTVFADGSSTLKATIDDVTTQGLDQTSLDRTYVDALPFSVSDVDVVPELDLTSGPGGLDGVDLSAQIVDPVLMTAMGPADTTAPTVQPVPEPSTLAVFAAACGLIVARRRRR